jgi:putative spermidine/putrescine transport system permease protein
MGRFGRSAVAAVLFFLVLPAILILVSSLSAGRSIAFPPHGLSLRPYADLASNGAVRAAMGRSLLVGLEAVVVATLTGVPAVLAIVRHRVRLRGLVSGYLMLGVTVPLLTVGYALLILYTKLGLLGELWTIGLAVGIVYLPLMLFAVGAAAVDMDDDLELAAQTLGAERVQTFLFVTLPAIMPGIVAGAIIVFVYGITDFLLTLILSTASTQTLPLAIFDSLRGPVPPLFAAAAGVYVIVSAIVVLAITNLRSAGAFLYRPD